MLWMYCIEASPGIYKSTRLGGQDSPGYIWQSTIHISTTTKYQIYSNINLVVSLVQLVRQVTYSCIPKFKFFSGKRNQTLEL